MCECAHACECLCEGKSIATGSGGKAPGPPDQGLGEDFSWVIRPDTNVSSQAKKRVGRVQQGGFTQALLRVDALMEPQREPGPGHSAEATCKPVAAAQGLGLIFGHFMTPISPEGGAGEAEIDHPPRENLTQSPGSFPMDPPPPPRWTEKHELH